MKKLSILLMIAGLTIIFYGGLQIFQSNKAQQQSLAEAKTIIQNRSQKKSPIINSSPENETIEFSPEQGETVGVLLIPKIDGELPIIEGTHEDELKRGVGHYKGTAYPLQNDQIVLSGHRDTVFRRMAELELGDILTIELEYGTFSYEITDFQIVGADDRTIIASTAPNEVLTVTTCYPFRYVGNAPDRFIITALPINE